MATWKDRPEDEAIRKGLGIYNLSKKVEECRQGWIEDVLRIEDKYWYTSSEENEILTFQKEDVLNSESQQTKHYNVCWRK